MFIILFIEYYIYKPVVLLQLRTSLFRFSTYDNKTLLTLKSLLLNLALCLFVQAQHG